jgi:hypothetical protein
VSEKIGGFSVSEQSITQNPKIFHACGADFLVTEKINAILSKNLQLIKMQAQKC